MAVVVKSRATAIASVTRYTAYLIGQITRRNNAHGYEFDLLPSLVMNNGGNTVRLLVARQSPAAPVRTMAGEQTHKFTNACLIWLDLAAIPHRGAIRSRRRAL